MKKRTIILVALITKLDDTQGGLAKYFICLIKYQSQIDWGAPNLEMIEVLEGERNIDASNKASSHRFTRCSKAF